MTKRFMNPNGKILVGVNLDDHGAELLKSAAAIARRTGLGLAVAHVSQYWVGRAWPTEMMLGGPMGGLVSAVEDETINAAQSRLREMVKANCPDMEVKEDVLLGYPADSLRAHAQSMGAEILIVSGASEDYKFIPRGMSTVLGLMADAPCPVLALPKKSTVKWDSPRLKAVLADDLQPQTEEAVIVGYECAAAFSNTDVIHTHVNQMTKADLKDALATAAASAHTPQGALDANTVWENSMKSIQEAMTRRAPGRKQMLEARGGTSKYILLQGSPTEEVIKFATAEKADLIVFGRHHTWRRKPFAVGQMPFHSMLKSGKAVLIAGA